MTSIIQGGGTCWSCGAVLTPFDYGRGDTCGKCGRDTRVCKGCIHYDLSSNNECRENQADRVLEKERSNFCDYFKPSSRSKLDPNGAPNNEPNNAPNNDRDAMKAAAEALFKKK